MQYALLRLRRLIGNESDFCQSPHLRSRHYLCHFLVLRAALGTQVQLRLRRHFCSLRDPAPEHRHFDRLVIPEQLPLRVNRQVDVFRARLMRLIAGTRQIDLYAEARFIFNGIVNLPRQRPGLSGAAWFDCAAMPFASVCKHCCRNQLHGRTRVSGNGELHEEHCDQCHTGIQRRYIRANIMSSCRGNRFLRITTALFCLGGSISSTRERVISRNLFRSVTSDKDSNSAASSSENPSSCTRLMNCKRCTWVSL